jgi:hypothetical protein
VGGTDGKKSDCKVQSEERRQGGYGQAQSRRRARAEEEVRVRQTKQGVKHGARYPAEACYIEDDGKAGSAGSQVDLRQSSPNGGWSREFDRVQCRRAGDVASEARRGKESPLIRSIP